MFKIEKVQCLVTHERWPGIVLCGGVFYNLLYVKGLNLEIRNLADKHCPTKNSTSPLIKKGTKWDLYQHNNFRFYLKRLLRVVAPRRHAILPFIMGKLKWGVAAANFFDKNFAVRLRIKAA